jgi:hypothetical protein
VGRGGEWYEEQPPRYGALYTHQCIWVHANPHASPDSDLTSALCSVKQVMEKSLESWKMYYLCMVTESKLCTVQTKRTPTAVCKLCRFFLKKTCFTMTKIV